MLALRAAAGSRRWARMSLCAGRFVVTRIVRPRLACRGCEAICQAPLPSRAIERGRPGPGLLADVLVAKYGDHLPLYRQSQIFEREGIDLDRSTLADWVGKSTALPEPLADAIGRHVLGGAAIFADDTPIKLQAPGNGKTRTARIWAYLWTAPLCKAFGDLRRTFGAATTSCSETAGLDEIRGTAPKYVGGHEAR